MFPLPRVSLSPPSSSTTAVRCFESFQVMHFTAWSGVVWCGVVWHVTTCLQYISHQQFKLSSALLKWSWLIVSASRPCIHGSVALPLTLFPLPCPAISSGPWQVMFKQSDGSYACVAEAADRFPLGQVRNHKWGNCEAHRRTCSARLQSLKGQFKMFER